jgi:hypothetical protein
MGNGQHRCTATNSSKYGYYKTTAVLPLDTYPVALLKPAGTKNLGYPLGFSEQRFVIKRSILVCQGRSGRPLLSRLLKN